MESNRKRAVRYHITRYLPKKINTQFGRVVLTWCAVVLTLLGSAYVAARVVSAHNRSAISGFPAFNNNGYTLNATWFNQFWPATATLLGIDHCSRDKYGICMVDIHYKFYNQPVTQAQDGLYSLAEYANGGSSTYLTRAEAEANRILSYKTGYKGAWWFPYKFNFEEYGQKQYTAVAPWYSGMAQGEILDLFTKLYIVTGTASWATDARETFTSFLDPRTATTGKEPWVDIVNTGYLWIEEYPTPNLADDTINGADFAIWGLVDYATEFRNADAHTLASGALTTMLHAIPKVLHPGWMVGYSVSHPTDDITTYHAIVTEQFVTFAEITGNSAFANVALELSTDFPIFRVTGTISLSAGPHQMAHVNSSTLTATSVSTVKVPATTMAPVTARVKLSNESGYWYAVATSLANAATSPVSIDQVGMLPPTLPATLLDAASNPYAGLYIKEQSGAAYYRGICNQLDFTPSFKTTFPAGSYTVYTSTGQVLTETGTFTLVTPEVIPVSNYETIGGVTAWAVSSGTYADDFLTGPVPTVA